MKNIVLSAVAVFAMSSFAVAGGDIAPIEEPEVIVEEVIVENTAAGFYLGLGYGSLSGEETIKFDTVYSGTVSITDESRDFDQLLLMAGYKVNSYVAVEGRYWLGMNDLDEGFGIYNGQLYSATDSLDAWGIYVKPMYPVTTEFDVYALLGYAKSTLENEYKVGNLDITDSRDLDGFSWGLGVAYTFNDSISIFADYVVLYDDNYDEWKDLRDYGYSSDFVVDTINVGVSYKF